MADLKSTHLFDAGGHHEIACGWHPEYVTYDQERWYSGPLGNRALIQLLPAAGRLQHLLVLHAAAGRAAVRLRPRRRAARHRPALPARLPGQPEGERLEHRQRVLPAGELQPAGPAQPDDQRRRAARVPEAVRLPRQGVPRRDQRQPARRRHLGSVQRRPVEALVLLRPLLRGDPAQRGRPLLRRRGHPACATAIPFGECRPPRRTRTPGTARPSKPAATRRSAVGDEPEPDGQRGRRQPPVQQRHQLRRAVEPAGQYHNEIVATAEREIIEDTTVRLDYQHRWLGTIIEDGAADPSLTFVLANPGHVPRSALDDARRSRRPDAGRSWTPQVAR